MENQAPGSGLRLCDSSFRTLTQPLPEGEETCAIHWARGPNRQPNAQRFCGEGWSKVGCCVVRIRCHLPKLLILFPVRVPLPRSE